MTPGPTYETTCTHPNCLCPDENVPCEPGPPPADRLRSALTTLHWSGRLLAGVLRRDERMVRRWLSGAYEPPEPVLAWLETLAAFHAAHPVPEAGPRGKTS